MKKIIVTLALLLPLWMSAQTVITLKSAIDTTLSNSFNVKLAENNFEISKINNTPGVAGMLPTINASVNNNKNLDVFLSSANGNTLSSNVTAGIVLFNGFRIWATRERLDLLQSRGELQLNSQIQNSLATVMTAYYDVVRQQEYLTIIQTSLDVSRQKLEIVTARRNVGMANDADYFQALIDVNSSEQSLKAQQLQVDQAKTDLLQIMSGTNYYPFVIQDTIEVDRTVDLNSVTGFLKQNPQYLSAEQQVKINQQIVKEVAALRYPSLRLSTGYNYNRSQGSTFQLTTNENYGPFVGLNLQVPIYNGNASRAQKKAAIINVNNAELQKNDLLNTMTSDAVRLYQSYSTSLAQLDSQLKAIETSGKLVDLVLKRFQVSEATILEVKAAQASYEGTAYQLVNLNYAAKVAEIELKRLMFQLGN
ncbi:MAG: TolC family protein [Methylococcaceae bacterium]|nr:TolC family protein [Prolixibacteraceae bacterium]